MAKQKEVEKLSEAERRVVEAPFNFLIRSFNSYGSVRTSNELDKPRTVAHQVRRNSTEVTLEDI